MNCGRRASDGERGSDWVHREALQQFDPCGCQGVLRQQKADIFTDQSVLMYSTPLNHCHYSNTAVTTETSLNNRPFPTVHQQIKLTLPVRYACKMHASTDFIIHIYTKHYSSRSHGLVVSTYTPTYWAEVLMWSTRVWIQLTPFSGLIPLIITCPPYDILHKEKQNKAKQSKAN